MWVRRWKSFLNLSCNHIRWSGAGSYRNWASLHHTIFEVSTVFPSSITQASNLDPAPFAVLAPKTGLVMRSSRGLGSVGANSSTHSVPWNNVAIPDLIMEKERKKEMYNEGSTPRIGTSRSTKALGTGVALVGLKVVGN